MAGSHQSGTGVKIAHEQQPSCSGVFKGALANQCCRSRQTQSDVPLRSWLAPCSDRFGVLSIFYKVRVVSHSKKHEGIRLIFRIKVLESIWTLVYSILDSIIMLLFLNVPMKDESKNIIFL